MRRSFVLLASVALSFGLLAAPSGSTPVRASSGFSSRIGLMGTADVVFPAGNLSRSGNVSDLGSFLARALGLPPVNKTYDNGRYIIMCCLWDFRGNNMGMENGSSAVVGFQGDLGMNLEYSSTGRLADLDLVGAFGPSLSSIDWPSMVQRTREIAGALGLGAFPFAFVGSNTTGTIAEGALGTTTRQATVTAFSDPYSLPLLFANQLTVTFDVDRGLAVRMDAFPWFTAAPPTVSPSEAASSALALLNSSAKAGNPAVANGSWVSALHPYLGLDSIPYSLAYDVEVTYTAESHNPPGYPTTVSYDYHVWVDAYTGTATSWVWILPHDIPTTPFWPIWALIGVAAASSALLVLMIRRRRATPPPKGPEPSPPKPRG